MPGVAVISVKPFSASHCKRGIPNTKWGLDLRSISRFRGLYFFTISSSWPIKRKKANKFKITYSEKDKSKSKPQHQKKHFDQFDRRRKSQTSKKAKHDMNEIKSYNTTGHFWQCICRSRGVLLKAILILYTSVASHWLHIQDFTYLTRGTPSRIARQTSV